MINHYDKVWYCDQWVVTRLQSTNWDQEISDEDIEEIGNPGIIETIIDPIVPNTVTLNTNDWGATDFIAQVMGSEADVDGAGNPYDSSTANRNDWIVSSADMNVQKCDLICQSQDTQFERQSTWIPNAGITSVNWAYSVDGNATENVTLRGDADRHLFGEYRDAGVLVMEYSSGTTAICTSTISAAARTCLFYSVNGTIYDDSDVTSLTGATAVLTVTTGGRFSSGDRIRVCYFEDSPGTMEQLDTSELGAIKGSYVVASIGEEAYVSPSTKTLRLQSVDVTATPTREDIKELGTEQLVDTLMIKHEVSVEATVLEEDMENFARMHGVAGSAWTNRASTGVVTKLQDSIGVAQELNVRVYDSSTQDVLLKTLICTGLRLLRSPFSLDIGGQSSYTLSLRGDNWLWTGAGDVGRLVNAYPSIWDVVPGGTSTSTSTTTTTIT